MDFFEKFEQEQYDNGTLSISKQGDDCEILTEVCVVFTKKDSPIKQIVLWNCKNDEGLFFFLKRILKGEEEIIYLFKNLFIIFLLESEAVMLHFHEFTYFYGSERNMQIKLPLSINPIQIGDEIYNYVENGTGSYLYDHNLKREYAPDTSVGRTWEDCVRSGEEVRIFGDEIIELFEKIIFNKQRGD